MFNAALPRTTHSNSAVWLMSLMICLLIRVQTCQSSGLNHTTPAADNDQQFERLMAAVNDIKLMCARLQQQNDYVAGNLTITLRRTSAAPGVPAACSFPFTYHGRIYYSCATSVGRPSSGCRTAGSVAVLECNSPEFVAVNVTYMLALHTQPTVLVPSVFGWIAIHHKYNRPSISWNRTWFDYRNGFGSFDGDSFWLGLERVHLLTSNANYRLRVEILTEHGEWRSAEYQTFRLDPNRYAIHVSGFVSHDLHDGFEHRDNYYWDFRGGSVVTKPCDYMQQYQNGHMFSTSESFSYNNDYQWCSSSNGAGWWYSRCGITCLTCDFMRWMQYRVVKSRMLIK